MKASFLAVALLVGACSLADANRVRVLLRKRQDSIAALKEEALAEIEDAATKFKAAESEIEHAKVLKAEEDALKAIAQKEAVAEQVQSNLKNQLALAHQQQIAAEERAAEILAGSARAANVAVAAGAAEAAADDAIAKTSDTEWTEARLLVKVAHEKATQAREAAKRLQLTRVKEAALAAYANAMRGHLSPDPIATMDASLHAGVEPGTVSGDPVAEMEAESAAVVASTPGEAMVVQAEQIAMQQGIPVQEAVQAMAVAEAVHEPVSSIVAHNHPERAAEASGPQPSKIEETTVLSPADWAGRGKGIDGSDTVLNPAGGSANHHAAAAAAAPVHHGGSKITDTTIFSPADWSGRGKGIDGSDTVLNVAL